MQKPRISRNLLYIIVAVAMAAIAAMIAIRYVQQQVDERTRDDREMIELAVPLHDMPQGAVIGDGDLAIRSVPAELAPADAVTPDNHSEYTGRMLRAPIRGGAPLSAAALVPLYDQFSKVIPKGKVAYNLSVDENNSIAGMVAPGDRIDILFLKDREEEKGGPRLFPLLEQVRVLATGTRVGEKVNAEGSGDAGNEGYSTLTLELDHYQAKRLAMASRAGSLRVLLREFSDASPGAANGLSERELLRSLGGDAGSPAARNGIEFIIGGKG